MKIIKIARKRSFKKMLDNVYIYEESFENNQINEKSTVTYSKIFDTLIRLKQLR